MPVLFVGHGSPMIALEENSFTKGFNEIVKTFPKPDAILCISAHWETIGTKVTAMPKPQTIHDFGGFPRELYEVQYPAPGSPALADEIVELLAHLNIEKDFEWGLDHGAWTVLKHMYPNADIPVVQLSLDQSKSASEHYNLAQQLAIFREKNILIMGSGNMIHNLRRVDWRNLNSTDYAYDWARTAGAGMEQFIIENNHQPLIDYSQQGIEFQISIPTPEHYLPMLYALALKQETDEIGFFNRGYVGGSLSMLSFKIG